MPGKKIIFYILSAFIAGTLTLVYIQYNSAKNISSLISGNEKLVNEFKVDKELRDLEKGVLSIENKIRGTVVTRDTSHIEGLETQIAEIETDLDQLQKVSDDDSSVKYIDKLDRLVQEKLQCSNQVLDSFHIAGKNAAEKVIAFQKSKRLTDSITNIIHKIDSTRKGHLADITGFIDESGKKAQQFSFILIALVLLSAAGLFWYIIHIIRRQIQLIQDLNISEKKVKESAQVKENFMANVSHEIRTPMNAILGFTNLLQRQNLNNKSKEYVQTIQKSGESLLTIINDILDMSKIEAGMMRIETAPFSLRGLTHSVEAMFIDKAKEKGIILFTRVDDEVPDILEGDSTRLTQILVNLIGNALKFTKDGSITIHITDEGRKDNLVNTGITITDTGIGVEQEKLKRIFERFKQADDTVTRQFGGTGLGLSIVTDLVSLQNGTINVESELGKGTSFKIVIPYKVSNEDFGKSASSEILEAIARDFEHIKILVVEDNEINQSLIKHLFSEWQLEFDLANNGKEAIAALIKNKYHLILMDIQMPEMDGYTAAQEIRRTLNLDTPIIAMTAHALAGEREKCLSYGMNEYISKPIREEQLHKLISQFTRTNIPQGKEKLFTINSPADDYAYIDLRYMKEVSGGNIDYEKTVSEQFIEAIPEDLAAMEKAWQNNDTVRLRQLAHNMKTTVSVMGLNEVLQSYLDAIEHETLSKESFQQNFSSLKLICDAAVVEAQHFYSAL